MQQFVPNWVSELPAMRIVIRQLVGARVSVLGRYGKGHVRVSSSPKGRACLPSATVELQDRSREQTAALWFAIGAMAAGLAFLAALWLR